MGIYVLFSQPFCELIHSCSKYSLNYAPSIVTWVASFSSPPSLIVLIQTLLCVTGTVLSIVYHLSSKNKNSSALKGCISQSAEGSS